MNERRNKGRKGKKMKRKRQDKGGKEKEEKKQLANISTKSLFFKIKKKSKIAEFIKEQKTLPIKMLL